MVNTDDKLILKEPRFNDILELTVFSRSKKRV